MLTLDACAVFYGFIKYQKNSFVKGIFEVTVYLVLHVEVVQNVNEKLFHRLQVDDFSEEVVVLIEVHYYLMIRRLKILIYIIAPIRIALQ